MRISTIVFVMLGGLTLLTACSDSPPIVPIASEPDIVTVKLAQAADKASSALDSIAGIEQYKNPSPPAEDDSRAPPNLMQPVSVRWSGPIDQIVKSLAEHAGLKYRAKGNLPSAPLIVNVDAYQVPILHVLRDIGLQAGHRADLSVDATSGVVEVRYAPADLSQ